MQCHSIFDGIDDVYAADLSPRGLIEAGVRQFYDDRAEMEKLNPWGILRFEREEQGRIFRLLSDLYGRCSEEELQSLNVPELNGLLFSVSRFDVGAARGFVGEAYEQSGSDKSIQKYRNEQLRVSRDFEKVKSAFARIFMAYALCYWHEHDICGDERIDGMTFGGALGKFLSDSLMSGLDGDELDEMILSFLKEDGPRYDKDGERASKSEENVSNPVYDFFSRLFDAGRLLKRGREGFDHFLSIRNEQESNVVVELLRSYRSISGICDFLDFCYYPFLSAGQEALLSMWGRVYDWMMNPRRLRTPKEYQRYDPDLYDPDEMSAAEFYASCECFEDMDNVVVFFDEAETSLHPEWQRRFLHNTLCFLQRFGEGYNVQVVLATHSPILLSDIPKGNVHFLLGNDTDREAQRASLQELKNTFAANIYDLYQMSFFLKNGPIGEFAKGKLESLKEHPDDRIVNLVGDDLLKRLLPREKR